MAHAARPRWILPRLILFLAIFAALLPSPAQAAGQVPNPPVFLHDRADKNSLVGKPAPSITLGTDRKNRLNLQSFRGHPVLIIFWATWCGECTQAIQNLPQMASQLPPDLITIAVDFDRDPAAATAFLARTNNSIRNFHDDGHIRNAFHLTFQPFSKYVLIDSQGRVIFSARTIFNDELLATVATFSSPPKFRQIDITAAAQARTLAQQAVQNQSTFEASQKKFVCSYDIITRDHYDTGISVRSTQHVDEVLATNGHGLESLVTSQNESPQADANIDAASKTFSIWTSPILTSVLAHSILSNVRPFVASGSPGQQSEYLQFAFRGDPAFTATTPTDAVAQSLEGFVILDLSNRIFVHISGDSAYNVIVGKLFSLPQSMPILDFYASPFQGINLPSIWSAATYNAVPNGPNAERLWNATLIRTFGERKSCQEYHVTTKIIPGYQTVQPEK